MAGVSAGCRQQVTPAAFWTVVSLDAARMMDVSELVTLVNSDESWVFRLEYRCLLCLGCLPRSHHHPCVLSLPRQEVRAARRTWIDHITESLFLPLGALTGEGSSVNVNTTDATAGATALLLPAQNTHTLHDPIRNPAHARAGRCTMLYNTPTDRLPPPRGVCTSHGSRTAAATARTSTSRTRRCVIRVPVCARVSCVSRVCPGSRRCHFLPASP